VSIPRFLADMLAEQLQERSLPGPDGLVFPNTVGKPLVESSFSPNVWRPALRRAGIPPMRFHDLRHTAVALAIAEGAHPKAIQARVGHASAQMTLDRYGHLFPELDETIADRLDAAYLRVVRDDEDTSSSNDVRTSSNGSPNASARTQRGHTGRETRVHRGRSG
jgi:integrase